MQLLAKFTQESLCHGARITRAPFFFPSGASACRATVPRPRMQESQLGVRHLRPNAAVYRRVHLGEGLSCDTASSKGSPAQGRRDMDATPRKMISLISDAYTRFVVPVYQRLEGASLRTKTFTVFFPGTRCGEALTVKGV